MLDMVEAVRFDRAMTKGRTLPLLMAAEHSDGREVELIGKFSHGQKIGASGLVREAISAMLAADLGLPVPQPLLVKISDAFIETVLNPAAADLLRQSLRVGFGSSRLPNGYSLWPHSNNLPKRMLNQAAEIFAFDALIQNADRRPDNPNMQVKGEQFAIYDHELAFIWEGVLFWKPPWQPGGLDNVAQPDKHVFFAAIKSQAVDLSRLTGAWEAISDARLAEYRAALPQEWESANDTIEKMRLCQGTAGKYSTRHDGSTEGIGMNKQAYSYTVLRYVHDVTTGEFVNVGVALYAPGMRYANATCRTTTKRLRPVFPSLDGDVFRALMRKVQSRFEELHDEVSGQLELRRYSSVMDLAQSVIPQDDSSLQWAPMGSGLTSDPAATLELLFERFVMKHEETGTVHRRNDDQVWQSFSRELQQQQVLKHFQPKTFTTPDDEIKFDRAWKNGVWHCLAPVSFDLASPESIREKAHKWLGQLASVGNNDLKLYFLVGEPSQAELKPVYQSALNILKKASGSAEVFAEADAIDLSRRLAAQVARHDAAASAL